MTVFAWLIGLLVLAALGFVAYHAVTTRKLAAQAERTIPMAGKTVSIDGERIHYVEKGQGRPILFVHGLGGQLHHFDHPLFEAMGDGHRLIAVDRAGSGYSTRVTSGARLPEQARLLASFIDTLGLERPLVVGHSLGGAIALNLALDHPDKLSGLALIAPLTRFLPRPPAEFGGLYIKSPLKRRFLAHTFAIPLALRNAQATLDFVFSPQPVPTDYGVAGGGWLGLRPDHFFAVSSDLVAVELDLPDQERRYGELAMPVGILYGDRDRVLDHAVHGVSMRERIKGLDLEILEGIGHMPQFVATERVAAFVKRIAAAAFRA